MYDLGVWIAPALFLAISLVFSMLGMGGSQLYIPVLYWLGMDFVHEAIPLGLALNVVVASSASVTYHREGMVRFRMAVPFALAMVLLAPLGSLFSLNVSTRVVIGGFALFTLTGALIVLSGWRPNRKVESHGAEIVLGIGAGSILGFLVGFTGRGGGAMVMPVLLLAGCDPRCAAATSSVIVAASSLSAFLAHLPGATVRPGLAAALVASVLLGSQAGSRLMAGRMPKATLRYLFSAVLIGVSLLLLRDALFGG